MSLTGKAKQNMLLKGSINRLKVIYTDAYELAVKSGFEGTLEEWLASLKGEQGEPGPKGDKGDKGADGKSVLTVAVRGGDFSNIPTVKFSSHPKAGDLAITEDGYIYKVISDNTLTTMSCKVELFASLTGSAASPASIATISLPASGWVGSGNLYSQVVDVPGATENSQVDLTPSVEQLAIFYEKDLTFVTENEGGVVTVYAIGQKPTNDYTMQVTITEVIV